MVTDAPTVERLRHDSIMPDPDQPRKTFDEGALWELAGSLREHGLLQPITVRPNPNGETPYILIAGERRWRAMKLLEWGEVHAIVRDGLSDREASSLQLLENIVRQDLNPVEEAQALQRFVDSGATVQDVAKSLGWQPYAVVWRVQMLGARDDVLHMVSQGQMTASMAYALSRLTGNGQARALRAMNVDQMNTREVETLCDRIYAEENQVEMFPGLATLTPEQTRAARTFALAFEQMGRTLTKLADMDQKSPGTMAEALVAEGDVAESMLEEATKALHRVKKAMQTRRMHLLAQEVE